MAGVPAAPVKDTVPSLVIVLLSAILRTALLLTVKVAPLAISILPLVVSARLFRVKSPDVTEIFPFIVKAEFSLAIFADFATSKLLIDPVPDRFCSTPPVAIILPVPE